MLYLYRILNTVNGKCYFGVTKRPQRRKLEHYNGHGSKLIGRAAKKYSKDALEFRILAHGEKEAICKLEKAAIIRFNSMVPNGYNRSEGGSGAHVWTDEAKQKISNFFSGRKHSSESIQKMKNIHKGKKFSAEHCENIRQAKLGTKHSPKSLKKICEINQRPEARERMRRVASKRVKVDEVIYNSIKDAAAALKINYSTFSSKFCKYKKENNFPEGWGYIT